ncbi:hypothetical protein DH2020_007094 [Rehmannia glutinosa]|uniref:F-box domain-containing protein n=1 Tax=Rehmannia glutinosa TaxID=99300 RepID=A0ABR0TY27_REHGL
MKSKIWHQKTSTEEDRISKLPDAIIQHILSSLDPKQAVQTSVLSKQWTKLWSTLPDLNFNFRHLATKSGVDLAWSHENEEFMPRFMRFVTQFLSHRDDTSTIAKFQLSSSHMAATDSTFVENCIDYAIKHGVQLLDLDAYCGRTSVRFPDGFFASKTLRVLRLRQYTSTILVPKQFYLPNVNTLYLDSFKFNDDDGDIYSFPKEPFSKFDNLEELTLHRCEVSEKMEQILAPRLISFRYDGYVSLVCPKMDLPCLEEVYFDNYANLEAPYTDDIKKKMPLNLVKMLQQLGNAKFVTLTLHTIEVLAMDPQLLEQSPSPFPYMKRLKFTRRRYGFLSMETVPLTVMNYLTKGCSYGDSMVVEFPEGN